MRKLCLLFTGAVICLLGISPIAQACDPTGNVAGDAVLSSGQNELIRLAGGAAAKNNLTPGECVQDPTDPYDPRAVSQFGSNKGKCIDSRTVRPVVILGEDSKSIRIANFYHEGKYYIATIPKDAVQSVIFQGIPIGKLPLQLGIVAHTQFRFVLKDGRKVDFQEQAGSGKKHVSISDVIISSTYTAPVGVSYNIEHSQNFGLVTRAMSSTSRGSEEMWKDQDQIHQFLTTMSPDIGSAFLINSIRRSAAVGYSEKYGLLDNNCTTFALDTLDQTVPRRHGVKRFRGNLEDLRDETMRPALRALKQRGFLPQNSDNEIADMNDQLICVENEYPHGLNGAYHPFPTHAEVSKDNRLTPPCKFLRYR